MATKDVRVRLSAEGQAEVIAAFRRIQEETDKANRSAKSASREGFNDLKDAAHRLALEYIGLQSAMKVFDLMKSAVETSIEYATGIEKASQKTGFAAETLQVFGVAAQQVGVSQEVITKGLAKFQKSMYDLELGAPKAANAIKELFGNKDALKGLPDEQRLEKVTEALARMEPGAKRTGIAMTLFGKAGQELLPVLDSLGSQGFDALKAKLEQYGVALDAEGIERARMAERSMADLKLSVQGIQMQFTQGLLPALGDVSEGLAHVVGPSGWKAFGEFAGSALKGTIMYVASLAIQIRSLAEKAYAAGQAMLVLNPAYQIEEKMRTGHFKSLPEAYAGLKSDWQESSARANAEIQTLGDLVSEKSQVIAKNIRDKGGSASDVTGNAATNAAKERLYRARLEAEQAAMRDELALYKETAKLEADQEKVRYDEGLETITQYFAKRRALEEEDIRREIENRQKAADALRAQRSGAKDEAARVAIDRQIADLENQIAVLKVNGSEQALALQREEYDAHKRNAQEVLGFEEKILVAQGNRHEAEARKIDAEMKKYEEALRREGTLTDEEIQKRVATASGVLGAVNDFEALKTKVADGMAELEAARARINDAIARHVITQAEGTRQLKALDESRLPPLRAILAQMQAIAQASGLPQLQTEVAQVNTELDKTDAALEHVKKGTKDAATAFNTNLQRSMGSFFTSGLEHARSFNDAIRGLGMSVAQDMNKLFMTLISNMLKAKAMAGGGGGGGFMGFLSGMFQAKAGGGRIDGPGTGTSDSVPIFASRGEFVVREAVASRPGVGEFLAALNDGLFAPSLRGGVPGYARGGVVADMGFAVAGSERNPSAQMTVGLDYGLVLKSLDAHPDFGRVLVKHLDLNRKAANSALGKSK